MGSSDLAEAIEEVIQKKYKENNKLLEQSIYYIYSEKLGKEKTGELLKLCVRMGAILADASKTDIENLTKYAKNIGLAFQIKDDILSEEGNEKILGKPVGNDKKRKKCTYVSKYGLEKSKEILQNITEEAIKYVSQYNNSEFLVEFAKYIANRNK